jgi:uncharacterized protein YqkB
MKQFLSLFLLLLPCLAWAQYPSNGNQKITLGEQTSADGLIFRGVAADTTLTVKSDTAAYFVLDTVNINLYTYKASATGRKWRQLGADTASIAYVNTYGTQTVNGEKTFTSAVTATRFNPTASTLTGTGMFLPAANTLGFSTNGTAKLLISPLGNWSTDSVSKTTAVYKTFELGKTVGTLILAGRTDGFNYLSLGTNWYYDGGASSKYIGASNSSRYEQFLGDHIFSNAGIGVANNNITYTELARITKEGNVGIGIANPTNTINVYNSNASTLYQTSGTGTGGGNGFYVGHTGGVSYLYNYNNFPIVLATNSVTRMTVTNSGNVGIGTGSPLALLNVMGTVRINSASAPDANYYLQLENSSSQKAKANAWDTYSDSRIKTNRQPIINAIDKINLLNPTYYNQHDSYVEDDLLNIDYNNSYKSLGFIAQEVYEVIPEAVNMGTTNELWAMDYTKLIPILTKAIQEQQALIKALEQRIINLENK